MPRRGRYLTRANALTGVRAAAAPLLVLALLHQAHLAAGLLFAVAVATDLADGPIARRFGEASPLGGLLDHATDALFVSAGLGALAHLGQVPSPLPWLVALAFLQYAIDSRITGSRPLRASPLGHWNGIAYFVLLGIPIGRDALALGWPGRLLVAGLGWVLVASTLASMAERARALVHARRQAQPEPEG